LYIPPVFAAPEHPELAHTLTAKWTTSKFQQVGGQYGYVLHK